MNTYKKKGEGSLIVIQPKTGNSRIRLRAVLVARENLVSSTRQAYDALANAPGLRMKHMSKGLKFNLLLVGTALLVICLGAAAQKSETYKVRLATVPVDATMLSRVAGSGSLTAVLAGNKLTFSGTFQGLRSPATHASIHVGPKGIPGPPIHDLMVSNATAGTVTGTVELTPSELEDLRNAKFYVQVDSEKAPEGNLWGWLLR